MDVSSMQEKANDMMGLDFFIVLQILSKVCW